MRKKQFLTLSTLPNSANEPLEITSPDTGKYNCIAWALGKTAGNLWPIWHEQLDWPADLPRVNRTESIVLLFQKHGFEICEHGKPERGFEEIALFEKDGLPTHACRLLKNELWTSKIGTLEDVQHSLPAISGGMYGEVAVFMKRRKP